MTKIHSIIGFILVIISLFLLAGCATDEVQYTNEEIESKLSGLQQQITESNEKIKLLEATQEANIISIADLTIEQSQQSKSKYNDNELPEGCVSEEKLNFWFDKYQEKDINKRQYDIIQRRFNECH